MRDGASGAYFERVGDSSFAPTVHVGGGWDPAELHFSPLAGLIVHAMETYREAEGRDRGLVLGRISYDILGRLAADACDVTVETIRPGRTIELLEATLSIGGRPVIRARGWYLSNFDTGAIEGGIPARFHGPTPGPDSMGVWDLSQRWPGGYIASLEVRYDQEPEPGRATAWVRPHVTLLAGEEVSDVAALLGLVDTANGIAPRESQAQWMYPNVDLTVHLFRQPSGRRLGLDTSVTFGPLGQGVTRSVLYDEEFGAFGFAEQLLTIRAVDARRSNQT